MKLCDQKGQALVELALTIFVLLLIIFGITEFGRVMYIRSTLNNAAREGARMAAITPAPVSISSIQDYVSSEKCIPFDHPGLTVDITTEPAGFTSKCTINVLVSMPFTTLVPLLIVDLNGITLKGQASMKWEY